MSHFAVLLAFPGQLLIFFVPQPAQKAVVSIAILLSVRKVEISFPHLCRRWITAILFRMYNSRRRKRSAVDGAVCSRTVIGWTVVARPTRALQGNKCYDYTRYGSNHRSNNFRRSAGHPSPLPIQASYKRFCLSRYVAIMWSPRQSGRSFPYGIRSHAGRDQHISFLQRYIADISGIERGAVAILQHRQANMEGVASIIRAGHDPCRTRGSKKCRWSLAADSIATAAPCSAPHLSAPPELGQIGAYLRWCG